MSTHLDPDAVDQELLELAAIVESSEDAIISKGLDGIIRTWNRGAERLYGYSCEEAVGQSISMLAPDDRADEIPMIIDRIRLGERVDHLDTVRCRKDGREVYVSLTVSPVRDQDGTIIAASIIARDISRRKRAELALQASEQRLQAALVEARLNYQSAEKARRQAEALAQRLEELHAVVDVAFAQSSLEDLLQGLLRHVHARLRSHATMILLVDETGRFEQRVGVGATDATTTAIFATVGQSLLHRIVDRHTPIVVDDASGLGGPGTHGRGVRTVLGIPLVVQGRLIGALCTGQLEQGVVTTDDVQLLRLTADRAAVAIDNARLYERTHTVAAALQRSFLPKLLPSSPSVTVAARYLPAEHGMEVGGDWYDAFQLPDGRLGLVVGDVVGHGIDAASAMGQVRNALRAIAFDGDGPARTLERLNKVVHVMLTGEMTTLVYVLLDPANRSAFLANAGHPPPLLVRSNGSASFLDDGRSIALAVLPDATYAEAEFALEPGWSLLLYTDGLIERRGAGIEAGLDRLAAAAARPRGDVEQFLSDLLAELVGTEPVRDDIALVGLRVADSDR